MPEPDGRVTRPQDLSGWRSRGLGRPDLRSAWAPKQTARHRHGASGPSPEWIARHGKGINMKRKLVTIALTTLFPVVVLASGTGIASGASSAASAVDVPGAGFTNALGINSAGAIVGVYGDNVGSGDHSYLRQPDGTILKFDAPGSSGGSEAFGINAEGTIVGGSCDDVTCHGFRRSADGGYLVFDAPTATFTFATAIDDRGDIVGEYMDVSSIIHGFLRNSEGSFTTIDVPGIPGSRYTAAYGINNRGEISGYYKDASKTQHGYIREPNGTYMTIDPAGATTVRVFKINDEGEAIGAVDAPAPGYTFVRHADGALTKYTDLPGISNMGFVGLGLNDSGQLVGGYVDPQRNHLGWTWKP